MILRGGWLDAQVVWTFRSHHSVRVSAAFGGVPKVA